jgi:hypothetical protein
VSTMMLTIASNAHKHVATVLKSVEEWLGNNLTTFLFFDLAQIILSLASSW